MNPHPDIADRLITDFGEHLADSPKLAQDALLVQFVNGLEMELRFAGPEEYAIHWQWQGKRYAIDTAPLHRDLETFPNHLHKPDGTVAADTLTTPGSEPWDNVKALVAHLLASPELFLVD